MTEKVPSLQPKHGMGNLQSTLHYHYKGRPISCPRYLYLGLQPSHIKHGMVTYLLLHIISGSPHLQPQVSGPFIPLVSQQAARVPAPAVGFCSFRGADVRPSAHNEIISHPNPTPPPSPVPPPRFFLSPNFQLLKSLKIRALLAFCLFLILIPLPFHRPVLPSFSRMLLFSFCCRGLKGLAFRFRNYYSSYLSFSFFRQ